MKHILITAGGTTEAIDGVRQISNTSTGSLCAHIYEALATFAAVNSGPDKSSPEFRVHYVVSEKAMRPEVKDNLLITFYPVTDVKSVEAALVKLMAEYEIGYVIHGMAVSDFTKDYLIERESLIDELSDTLEKALDENHEKLTGEKNQGAHWGYSAKPCKKAGCILKGCLKGGPDALLKKNAEADRKIQKAQSGLLFSGLQAAQRRIRGGAGPHRLGAVG